MINKLLRQYGEHGNDYSPIEMGDKINEIIDLLKSISNGGENPLVEKPEEVLEIPRSLAQFAARSSATEDRVYLVIPEVKTKSWIKNPETLEKLGFKFSDVKDITNVEMDSYETSQSIDLSEKKPLEVIKPIDGIDKYNL